MLGIDPGAEISPARRRTGADLRAALGGTTPPDSAFARSISQAMSMLTWEMNEQEQDKR
jgi:hypothetical protein